MVCLVSLKSSPKPKTALYSTVIFFSAEDNSEANNYPCTHGPSHSTTTRQSFPPRHPRPRRARSLDRMWTGLIRRFSTEDTRLGSETENDEQHDKDGVNGVFTPTARRAFTASPFRPPPLEPLILHGYRDSTQAAARLLTSAIAEEIRTMIPERLRIVEEWHLIYSLEQDGASLSTLYQKCRHYEGRRVGFVLVVKDQEGGVSQCSRRAQPARRFLNISLLCQCLVSDTRIPKTMRANSVP